MTNEREHYEYKIVNATSLKKRSGAGEQERLLNELAAEGWELVDVRRAEFWDWASVDSLVLRRTQQAR